MRRHCYLLSRAGTILLLLAVAVSIIGYAAHRRQRELPAEIQQVEVVAAESSPAALVVAGNRLDPTLDALLVPGPGLVAGDPGRLAPRMPMFHLEADGELALVSTRGMRIVTIDVRDGVRPRTIGSLDLGDHANSRVGISTLARVGGNRAVVTLRQQQGLFLVDLTDPAVPRKLDFIGLPADLTDMLVVEGQLFAAGVRSGLWWVRIDGDRLRAGKVPGSHHCWRLAGAGNRLVAAGLQGELSLYETGRGGTLRQVGYERIAGEIRGITLGDEALHLSLADGTLREYAVAAWPRLVARGELQLPGRALRLVRDRESPLLACSLVGVGVALIDIRHPGRPVVAGWLASVTAVSDLAIERGRVLFVNNSGLQIRPLVGLQWQNQLPIEFPLDQRRKQLRLFSWQGEPVASDADRMVSLRQRPVGNRAVVPTAGELLAVPGDEGVSLFARRGSGFACVKRWSLANPVHAALIRDGRLYVLSSKALEVFACNAAGEGEKLARFEAFKSARAMAWVDPEYLLVADPLEGVMLVSVRDPARPRLETALPLPVFLKKSGGGGYDVLVSGRWAYVARGEFGVEVLDLLDPANPRPVQLFDTPGPVHHLALHGELLLAVDRSRGLQVMDTRGGLCRLLGTIALPAQIDDLVVAGETILTSSAAGAVSRLPAPAMLDSVQALGDGRIRIALPQGLPGGRYQLVLFNDAGAAHAAFSLPNGT